MVKAIYIKAVLTLVIYSVLSKSIFSISLLQKNFFYSLVPPSIFGAISGVIFLYLFSHEDFFKFAKVIENKKQKSEEKWLSLFKHSGKAVTTVAIGTVGGPILGALSARILLPKYTYRYLLVMFTSIPSTIFSMGLAKGVISIF